jgi:hypothetical protein
MIERRARDEELMAGSGGKKRPASLLGSFMFSC